MNSRSGPLPPSQPELEAADDPGFTATASEPTVALEETPARESATVGDGRLPGAVLDTDKFVERGLLGRGGSSVVVRAFDKDLLRDVAIKVLLTEFLEGSPETLRFTEEARITGQLEHPNIVPVHEFGVQPSGKGFLCMRLLEGQTLEETLNRAGPSRLEPNRLADLLQVFVKVCEAVAFAHSRGVIHRDLKPANIMMSGFGQVYVLDWGIAQLIPRDPGQEPFVRLSPEASTVRRIDPEGILTGTPGYMAPEQVRGAHAEIDARTDVFALGATLYQILTGRPPLSSDIVRSFRVGHELPAIVRPEKIAPAAPSELSRIAMRALAYDAGHRYATVGELKSDVEQFQRGTWHLPRTSVPAGTILVKEGEPGHSAYVIERGRCSAFTMEGSKEIELRVMGPGEVFGETAVFSEKPRTASVKALTDVDLLVVTSEVLGHAVGLNSWMGAFVKALADRFRETDERLRALERQIRDSAKKSPEDHDAG
jgi:serine/threonine-protein kinase